MLHQQGQQLNRPLLAKRLKTAEAAYKRRYHDCRSDHPPVTLTVGVDTSTKPGLKITSNRRDQRRNPLITHEAKERFVTELPECLAMVQSATDTEALERIYSNLKKQLLSH